METSAEGLLAGPFADIAELGERRQLNAAPCRFSTRPKLSLRESVENRKIFSQIVKKTGMGDRTFLALLIEYAFSMDIKT